MRKPLRPRRALIASLVLALFSPVLIARQDTPQAGGNAPAAQNMFYSRLDSQASLRKDVMEMFAKH